MATSIIIKVNKMIKLIYNEGQGFIEYIKEYKTLIEAIKKEGNKILDAKIYKNDVILIIK